MSPLFIANWKMELSIAESCSTAEEIERGVGQTAFRGDVVLCPSFPMLASVAPMLSQVLLGAQDCGWQERGAFTGVVSALTLKELGCRFVIVGHSERRRFCSESDALIAQKVRSALAAGLIPILCVGESWDERQAGHRDRVLFEQVEHALEGLLFEERAQRVCIAYEPVWVIGRGTAVEPSDIHHAREVILACLKEHYALDTIARAFSILYGGSVNADNIGSIISESGMEGVLVGGASLKAHNVLSMLRALTNE